MAHLLEGNNSFHVTLAPSGMPETFIVKWVKQFMIRFLSIWKAHAARNQPSSLYAMSNRIQVSLRLIGFYRRLHSLVPLNCKIFISSFWERIFVKSDHILILKFHFYNYKFPQRMDVIPNWLLSTTSLGKNSQGFSYLVVTFSLIRIFSWEVYQILTVACSLKLNLYMKAYLKQL